MIDGHRTIISKEELTDNLTHTVSISADESMVYLKINLEVEGKKEPFNTEKSFRNNVFGLEDMQITISSLDNEHKVKKYFGIGEIKWTQAHLKN